MSFTECCRFFFVLLPHIHFPNFFRSKISLNFQKIARVLPSFTEFCRVSASFCEFFRVFRVLPSFAQFCRVFLGFFSFRMTIVLQVVDPPLSVQGIANYKTYRIEKTRKNSPKLEKTRENSKKLAKTRKNLKKLAKT